jgi:hypothetical protein
MRWAAPFKSCRPDQTSKRHPFWVPFFMAQKTSSFAFLRFRDLTAAITKLKLCLLSQGVYSAGLYILPVIFFEGDP